MKKLAVIALTILCLFATGCTRDDAAAVPDRGEHAYVMPGATPSPVALTSGATNDPNPGPGEGFYTMQSGDRLYRVAKHHGVGLDWLIERNDIVNRPVAAGTRLIVPQR